MAGILLKSPRIRRLSADQALAQLNVPPLVIAIGSAEAASKHALMLLPLLRLLHRLTSRSASVPLAASGRAQRGLQDCWISSIRARAQQHLAGPRYASLVWFECRGPRVPHAPGIF